MGKPRSMQRSWPCALLAVGLLARAAAADTHLDALAREFRMIARAPGAVVAGLCDGEPGVGTAGVRQIGADFPVAPDDLWHVGSLTKSMTATLVARLSETGRIDRNASVGSLLGIAAPRLHPAYRDQGFEALLSHRAGLPANSGWFARALDRLLEGDPLSDRKRYVSRLLQAPPAVGHGEFHYSNAGYVVAAAMLEEATGEMWEDLIVREVFQPLGLRSAGFGPPPGNEQPWGHQRAPSGDLIAVEPGPRADNPAVLGPAGRVHISARDMLRYLSVHAARDPAYLAAESWDWLHRPRGEPPYALGWIVGPDGRLFHDGSNTMWFAFAVAGPGAGRAVFAAVNSGDAELAPSAFAAIAQRVCRAG